MVSKEKQKKMRDHLIIENDLTIEQIKKIMNTPITTNNSYFSKTHEQMMQSAKRITEETKSVFHKLVRSMSENE